MSDYTKILQDDDNVKTVSVIMYDLDNFKKYNDTYYHAQGDVALKKASEAVMNALDSRTKYLFRFGGEEFLIFAVNCSDDELLDIARGIKQSVFDAYVSRDDQTAFDRITISAGCARLQEKSSLSSDYITQADAQLYNAKKHGQNCVSFDDKIFR